MDIEQTATEKFAQLVEEYESSAQSLIGSNPDVIAIEQWSLQALRGHLAELKRIAEAEVNPALRSARLALMWRSQGDAETNIAIYLSKDPAGPESAGEKRMRYVARDSYVHNSAQCYINAYEASPVHHALLVINIANALRYNGDKEGASIWLRRGIGTAVGEERQLILETTANMELADEAN